ncbi:MAG: MerR family transcriptional regulator [Chloroflexota bacterium]
MFKIGEFARLTKVSIKMLRHYDEIDLFKPVKVDQWTSYRYYEMAQLPRLNRILALKELGFPLEQVGQMINSDLTLGELQAMFALRQTQLEQEMRNAAAKLDQVQMRLAQIEREGKMSTTEVFVKQVDVKTVVGTREVVPTPAQMRERCIALHGATRALIEVHDIPTDGISFALYYPNEEKPGIEDGIDVEMAYTIQQKNKRKSASDYVGLTLGESTVHEIPAATVAYAVYSGSFDDFSAVGQMHVDIHRWIEENGYQLNGASREYYLETPTGPDNPMGVMEIQFPVVKS